MLSKIITKHTLINCIIDIKFYLKKMNFGNLDTSIIKFGTSFTNFSTSFIKLGTSFTKFGTS